MNQNISVIIPMLNEANNILGLLKHLLKSSTSKNLAEILIVDGGSTDGSLELLHEFVLIEDQNNPLIKVLNSRKGRAKQMNFGAKHATGSILYFLHADSYPPNNFDHYIIEEVNKENLAGCFRMKFDHSHWWLGLAGWLTKFSWRACRGGDQSQFITKSLFEDIGGFDESYIIYEDNILINELYKRNEFVVIQKWLTSSARLYKEMGIWNVQYHFWTIYVKKWLGASAEELHAYYLNHLKLKKTAVKVMTEVKPARIRVKK